LVGTNKFFHFSVGEFDLNNQAVVRMNQETLNAQRKINAPQVNTVESLAGSMKMFLIVLKRGL